LREKVLDQLRSWIVNGELAPGEQLRETEVSGQLGVGRSTIREALLALADEQLVDIDAYRGARVRGLPADQVKHIYDVRGVVEALAARRTAERCAKEGNEQRRVAADLTRAWEDMRDADASGSFTRRTEADVKFHEAICVASQNPWLLSTWQRLSGPIRAGILSAQPEAVAPYQAAERHKGLLDPILTGDPEAAERAMRAHLEESATRLHEVMREKEATDRGQSDARLPESNLR
jgi:DNA-binding GntR family transcriptional regulator